MVMIRGARRDQVYVALIRTTIKFDMNVVSKKFHTNNNGNHTVTLKVLNSRGSGAKYGLSGRRTANACWHAYGRFFDEVFRECPTATIIANGRKITSEFGNWVDETYDNGHSWASDMCDCVGFENYKLDPPFSRKERDRIFTPQADATFGAIPLSRNDIPMGVEQSTMIEQNERRLEEEMV